MSDTQMDADACPAPAPRSQIAVLLIAAFVAGAVGAILVGQIGNVFVMSPEFVNMPLEPSPEYMARYNSAIFAYRSRNYAMHFLLIGSVLGFAIGAAGEVGPRMRSSIAGLSGGAIAGGIGGYLLGLAAAYSVQINRGEAINLWGFQVEPIVQTTALQCFVWAWIGVGIGGGWTLSMRGVRSIPRCIEGGMLGGLLAGVTGCIFTAIVFSNSSGFTFIPDKLTEKLLWAALSSCCVCLGLIYSILRPTPQLDKE